MKHYDSKILIREALREPGPDQQFVVTLRCLEGFDYMEIGAIMGRQRARCG